MVLDETLSELAAFEPNGFPVISLYLNTQPDEHGRDRYQAFVRKEFRTRAKTFVAGSSDRESFEKDAARINAYLENELKPAANGLVIFACSGADLFRAIALEAPVDEHRLYIYNQPHLYQLARLNDEYPRYAAVVADTNSARIFVFGLGSVLGKGEVRSGKTRTVKVGGWSQARYRRRTEKFRLEHAREVIDALDGVVSQERIGHIVLAGDEVIVPMLREELPQHLAEKVIDVLNLEVGAPETEVLQATLDSMREQDAKDDAAKVALLLSQYRGGGLATVGLRETLAALERGQVDELLISAALERFHPEEETIETGAAEQPEPRTVMLTDELVTKAQQTSAGVSFIQDASLLESVGGAGAFLRYRI